MERVDDMTNLSFNSALCSIYIVAMSLEVAEGCREGYSSENKHHTAEWFLTFLLKMASHLEHGRFFLVAKYQGYYWNTWDVPNSCKKPWWGHRPFKRFLFGEYYIDRLEDSPYPAKSCNKIQTLMAKLKCKSKRIDQYTECLLILVWYDNCSRCVLIEGDTS